MSGKLSDFAKDSQDWGSQIGDAMVRSFSAATDAVENFVRNGKLSVSDLVTSMLADFAKLAAQQFITKPLAGLLGSTLSGLGIDSFLSGVGGGGMAAAGGYGGAQAFGQGAPVINFNVKDAASVARSRSQLSTDAARILSGARRS